jgi:hypothetical protein
LVSVPPIQRFRHHGHARALTRVLDHALDLALGADPQDLRALGRDVEEEVLAAQEPPQGLAQVHDVDEVAAP